VYAVLHIRIRWAKASQLPGDCDRPQRDQQKRNPVLRPIALQTKERMIRSPNRSALRRIMR